jgi:N-acetylmuramoyl-L-alanine amidase
MPTQPRSSRAGELAARIFARAKASATRRLDFGLHAPQMVVVALVVAVVAVGYRAPQQTPETVSTASILDQASPNVDQVAAANVAAAVAQSDDMLVSANVSSLAISLNNKTDLAQTDDSFISKPQIISQATGRKGIINYTTKSDDTVKSVAAEFGISEDTVRWANKLTSDSLKADTKLVIPSITGVLYTVKEGDDTAKLADKYKADKDRIISFNDAELTGLKVGSQIVIPDGILPENERPGYVAPVTYTAYTASSSVSATSLSSTAVSGNGYAYGYCTYYAYNRRSELGKPIGGNWGNAVSWAPMAAASGYSVNHSPQAGDVLQNGGGYGHVAVVERVNGDGSIYLSEMNYVGWNIISNRTVPASAVGSYNFIH